MELGSIIRDVATENIRMEKEHNMLGHGRMINNMARGLKHGLMDHNIQELITWKRKMDKVITSGQMDLNSMDNGKKTKLMELDTFNGKMERNTTVNGETIICMALEYISIMMESCTLDNTLMTRKLVMVFINGQTVENTKAGGMVANNTA